MRIYENPYELMSEVLRDLDEMGIIVKPKSMQNKIIEGNEDYETKEIQNYVYTLLSIQPQRPLFLYEDTKDWADEEFKERVAKVFTNPGKAWEIRKDMWEQFLIQHPTMPEVKYFDYAYNNRLNPGLQAIIDELRRNPDSRQLWLPIFHEYDLDFIGGTKRVPCSLGYHILARDGKVNLTYIQRSADAVAHFGNDVYLAWRMMEYIAEQAELEPGMLTHHIFSFHAYRKDWDKLSEGIHNL